MSKSADAQLDIQQAQMDTMYIGMHDKHLRTCIDGVPIMGEVDTTLYMKRGCISVRAIETGQLSSAYIEGCTYEYTLRDTGAHTYSHTMQVVFMGRAKMGDMYYYHFVIIEA